jgi:hypothetical protein
MVQHFGGFCSSNKSAPAKRKKGFCTSHLPKNEDISGTIVFSASELWTLFKPIAVDVLS